MKVSLDDLSALIDGLTRLKEEREQKGGMPKDFYAIAKALRIVRDNLPDDSRSGASVREVNRDGAFAREVIKAVAYQISIELIKHNSKFNPDLFLTLTRMEM